MKSWLTKKVLSKIAKDMTFDPNAPGAWKAVTDCKNSLYYTGRVELLMRHYRLETIEDRKMMYLDEAIRLLAIARATHEVAP